MHVAVCLWDLKHPALWPTSPWAPVRRMEAVESEGYYSDLFLLGFPVLLHGLRGYRLSGIRSAGMRRIGKERLVGGDILPQRRSRVANVQVALVKGNFDIGFA